MAKRERMTIDERYKLIRNVKTKYLQAGWKEKGQILDTLVEATGVLAENRIRSREVTLC